MNIARPIADLAGRLIGEIKANQNGLVVCPATLCASALTVFPAMTSEVQSNIALWLGQTPETLPDFASAFRDLEVDLRRRQGLEWAYCNRVWLRSDPADRDNWLRIRHLLPSTMEPMDFSRDARMVADAINKRVAEETMGHIASAVAPEDITEGLSILTISALWMYSKWAAPFNKQNTHKGYFHCGNGGLRQVPFMGQTGAFKVAKENGMSCLRIPLECPGIEVEIAMPDGVANEGVLRACLSRGLKDVLFAAAECDERQVRMVIPAMTWGCSFDIAAVIGGLLPNGTNGHANGGHTVSAAVQYALVSMNEDGLGVASATTMASTGGVSEENLVVFVLDRPFVFLVKDLATGLILSCGYVLDPGGEGELR